MNIPSNRYAEGTKDVSLDGYKAIGVVGCKPNFHGAIIEWLRVYDDVLEYRVSRKSSSEVNGGSLFPRVLYLKV